MNGKRELFLVFRLFYSSMKKHSLEENEDHDEPTTDSMSLEAQAATEKKAATRAMGIQ